MFIDRVDRIADWKDYLVPSKENRRVERFLNSHGVHVFTGLVSSIESAMEIKADRLHVVIHPNVSSIVIIKPHNYLDILKHALQFFKEKEEYEMCATTVKLIDKVKEFRTKKIENMKNMIDELKDGEHKE